MINKLQLTLGAVLLSTVCVAIVTYDPCNYTIDSYGCYAKYIAADNFTLNIVGGNPTVGEALMYFNSTTASFQMPASYNQTNGTIVINQTVLRITTLLAKGGMQINLSNNGVFSLSCTVVGDNTSWNQTKANTMYYPLNTNPYGYINNTTIPAVSSDINNFRYEKSLTEEWIGKNTTNEELGEWDWTVPACEGNSCGVSKVNGGSTQFGVTRLTTGNLSTGTTAVYTDTIAVWFGPSQTNCVRWDQNITGFGDGRNNNFTTLFGYGDLNTASNALPMDGVFMVYNTSKWSGPITSSRVELYTAKNGVRSNNNTTYNPKPGSIEYYKICVYNNTRAELFINDTIISTLYTNIPNSPTRNTGLSWSINKKGGNLPANIDIDRISLLMRYDKPLW